jgi:hypothetical protein
LAISTSCRELSQKAKLGVNKPFPRWRVVSGKACISSEPKESAKWNRAQEIDDWDNQSRSEFG